MLKVFAAVVLMAVVSACASGSRQPYAVDKAACVQRGYVEGSQQYKVCLEQYEAIYDERSNRWRVEQSN